MAAAKKNFMRVSELAQRSGVSTHTVHYYLKEGLLSQPLKTGKTMAYYNETHLERIRLIKRLQKEENLPLAFMKERLASLAETERNLENKGGGGRTDDSTAPRRRNAPAARNGKNRRLIIDKARELFSQKGYHRTKISDITEPLKMGKGTFYLYFPNKRELFFSVIDDVIEHLVRETGAAIVDEEDVTRRLEIRVVNFIRTYRNAQQMIHLLRGQAVSEDQEPEDKVKEIYQKLIDPVAGELKNGVEQGLFQPMRTDLIGFFGVALCEALSYWLATHKDLSDEEGMIIMGNFFLSALGVPPRKRGKTNPALPERA